MKYKLQDLIDIAQFQSIQDRLNKIYSFPSAIIDNEGNILTATAWQDICTQFHRKNKECEQDCIQSDQYIMSHLHEANPAVSYRCPRGLVDNATPIIIDGVHYGNFFTGQFFLENPDREFFKAQAKRYGFDEEAYLDAVKRVPVWTREQLNSYLFFIKGLIAIIAESGLQRIREAETRKKIEGDEKRYRAILQTAMDGIWRVDLQGRLREVNDTYCRMSGYNTQELLAMHIHDLDAAEMPHVVAIHIQKLMEQGEDRFESRHRRKDGSIYDVEVSAQYRPIEGGQFVAFIRDITGRKQAEAEIRRSEEKLKEAQRIARMGNWELDLTKNTLLWSDGIYELFEINPGEFGASYEAFLNAIHPDDREMVSHAYAESLKNRTPYEISHRLLMPDGRIKWVNEICRTEYDNQRNQLKSFGIVQDITVHKQAEEALQESESRFRSIAEQSIVGISIVQDGILQYVNPKYAEMHGCRVGDMIGMPYIEAVYPDDRPLVEETVRKRLSGEISPSNYECRKIKRNGEPFWVEVYGVISLYRHRPAVIGVLMDITERKRLEEERLSLLERLNRSEKMEALGSLAGGVAHDMNNVLGVLSGYTELLQEGIPAGSPLKHYVKNILAASEKGAAIIQDLLTLARRGVIASEVVNINAVAADFFKSAVYEKLRAYHPEVKFIINLAPELLNIRGSAVHLEKTVMNLLSNAAEAISGQGEVTIRTENRYVDKALRGYDAVKEGDYVVLTVLDTGEGIPSCDLDKVFEPFYTKKKMGRSGTGLGLSIVWGTVKDHEGYIEVESTAGQGSTFTLYFPVTRETMSKEVQKVPIEQYRGHGESVLVVDDVSEQRGVATSILTLLGYKADAVSSGEEAVEYLKSTKVDILVLDMIMNPGIDGLETYKRIIEINPHQKAIIVSGFSETELVRKAQELGAGAYVKKPYLKEKIGMAVRQELDRKGARSIVTGRK